VTPDGATVYVTDAASGTVAVVHTASNTVTSSFSVGAAPHGIALKVVPGGSSAYVADFGAASVSVVNLASNTVAAPITVGNNPVDLAVSVIKPVATALSAGTAYLTLLPLGEGGLNATLTAGGAPLAGQTITFTDVNGWPLCHATTNAKGRAVCDTAPGLLDTVGVLLSGYRASYAGNQNYLPSSAHGNTALL
jgi:YVTN family beta-propeller protein